MTSRIIRLFRRDRPTGGRTLVAVLSALLVLSVGCTGDSGEVTNVSAGEAPDAATGGRTATSTLDPSTTSAAELPTSTDAPATTTTAPRAAEPPSRSPAFTVTQVIDGDTLDISGGNRVRLIGIDTPERGECGYSEASAALQNLVGGRQVRLVTGARDDVDRYGRLLRYVEVDDLDVNLAMIRSGRAIARYDSRDGYGRHARESAYIAADAASPSANVCGPPAAPNSTIATGGTSLDPRYSTCREAKRYGYGPYVRGRHPEYDWYRDGDSDGTVCE
jgi:micrococcal nuclease